MNIDEFILVHKEKIKQINEGWKKENSSSYDDCINFSIELLNKYYWVLSNELGLSGFQGSCIEGVIKKRGFHIEQ